MFAAVISGLKQILLPYRSWVMILFIYRYSSINHSILNIMSHISFSICVSYTYIIYSYTLNIPIISSSPLTSYEIIIRNAWIWGIQLLIYRHADKILLFEWNMKYIQFNYHKYLCTHTLIMSMRIFSVLLHIIKWNPLTWIILLLLRNYLNVASCIFVECAFIK